MHDRELLISLLNDVETTADLLDATPDAPVVHCPGWTINELVAHHGGVLLWAEALVRVGQPVFEEHRPPDGQDALRQWYRDAAQRFATTASELDRDRHCWTFGRPPERVWFWIRRQALEAAVHRWDAEFAGGVDHPIRSDLASLGITEVVDDLFPRQVALDRSRELSRTITIRADDIEQDWIIGPLEAGAPGHGVQASASLLLQLLWRRVEVDHPGVRFDSPDAKDEWARARFAP